MRRMATMVLATAIALVFGAVTMAPAGYRYSGFRWGPSNPSYRYPVSKLGRSSSMPAKSQGYRVPFKQVSHSVVHSTQQPRIIRAQSPRSAVKQRTWSKRDFRDARARISNLTRHLTPIQKRRQADGKKADLKIKKLASLPEVDHSTRKHLGKSKDLKKKDEAGKKLLALDKPTHQKGQHTLLDAKKKGASGTRVPYDLPASPNVIPTNPINAGNNKPYDPKTNPNGYVSTKNPDGSETRTYTLGDGSKVSETGIYNQAGVWVPERQFTLTKSDGTQYKYFGDGNGNPIGPVTMVTNDPPGNGGPGGGGNDPGNGGMPNFWGGGGGGFDPTTVIPAIVDSLGSGGMGGGGPVAPSIDYSDPAPVPQPQIVTVPQPQVVTIDSQSSEPVQRCDIQKKLTEITGLIAQLTEKQKAVKDGSGDSAAVETLVKEIVSKLQEAEECAGSNPQVKAMIEDLYKVVEQLLA
jgi:hypothetical protein